MRKVIDDAVLSKVENSIMVDYCFIILNFFAIFVCFFIGFWGFCKTESIVGETIIVVASNAWIMWFLKNIYYLAHDLKDLREYIKSFYEEREE